MLLEHFAGDIGKTTTSVLLSRFDDGEMEKAHKPNVGECCRGMLRILAKLLKHLGFGCFLLLGLIFWPLCLNCFFPLASVYLDRRLTNSRAKVSWRNPFGYIRGRFADAEKRNITMEQAPDACKWLQKTDLAGNQSIAEDCREWCEENLATGAGWPLMVAMPALLDASEAAAAFKTCFKAQTATLGRHWLPTCWSVFVCALVYRLCAGPVAWAEGWDSMLCSEGSELLCSEEANTELQVAPDSEGYRAFPEGNWGFPFSFFYRATSDMDASRCKLLVSLFTTLAEPFSDLVSMLTFLRNGQPFYLGVMAFGFWQSAMFADGDLLQWEGLAEGRKSWRRGFATLAFIKHKRDEVFECGLSTAIQVFALLTLHPAEDAQQMLMLALFAAMTLAITGPEGAEAFWVWVWGLLEGGNVDHFYQVAEKKKSLQAWQKYGPCVWVLAANLSILMFSVRWHRVVGPVFHGDWIRGGLMLFLVEACFVLLRLVMISSRATGSTPCILLWLRVYVPAVQIWMTTLLCFISLMPGLAIVPTLFAELGQFGGNLLACHQCQVTFDLARECVMPISVFAAALIQFLMPLMIVILCAAWLLGHPWVLYQILVLPDQPFLYEPLAWVESHGGDPLTGHASSRCRDVAHSSSKS